mgnify:CR=1 FL=1
MTSQSSFEAGFEVFPDNPQFRWRYVNASGQEVMVSSNTFATEELARRDLDALASMLRGLTRGNPASASRWRPLAPDGTIGQLQPEPPDEPNEGETGPPETQDLCQQPDCLVDTAHFAH